MLAKLYDKIKIIIKDNYKFLILVIVFTFVFSFKLPYYIDAPGGLIDISKRINVDNGYEVKGSFNMAYVSEIRATIPTLIYAALNDDWDVFTREEITLSSEDVEDMEFRSKMMLRESNQDATILAYRKANRTLNITKTELVVTYIDEFAKTNLQVGDKILEINGIKVNSKKELNQEKGKYQAGDTLELKVIRDDKEIIRTAKLIWEQDNIYIGLIISELKEFTTDPTITYDFRSSESGPSGGLMISLAIYNHLIKEDLTKGDVIVGTGTIDLDGKVGSIGGIEYKLKGAVSKKAKIFIVPTGVNYEEAVKIKNDNDYDIELIEAKTFDGVVEYLKNR